MRTSPEIGPLLALGVAVPVVPPHAAVSSTTTDRIASQVLPRVIDPVLLPW
jgi:hypothetical protein